MREAIEISTGKHLETMEEINESHSAFICPACGLPVFPVRDKEGIIDHLKHPPYSRFYLLCPNMSSTFSKGTPGSFDNRSVNWNFNHLLKRLSRGLDLEGIEILTAVLNSRKREQQEHTALMAEGEHKLQLKDSILEAAKIEAPEIRERARREGRAQGLKLGEAECKKKVEEAEKNANHWFERLHRVEKERVLDLESVLLLHLQQEREEFELEKKEWREKHESGSI